MMRLLVALVAGWAAYTVISPSAVRSLSDRIGPHLLTRTISQTPDTTVPPAARNAGLTWSKEDLHLRWLTAGIAGATIGVLLGQGDLFLADPQVSTPALVILGAFSGLLGLRMWMTSRAERRSRQAIHELPAVSDALALSVLSGASLSAAIGDLVTNSSGVVTGELGEAFAEYSSGVPLTEALYTGAKSAVNPASSRLYSLLGHAHQSGGRLSEALNELARDFRAELQRSLTSEGGKKALAMYAPILALMVPVTLLFLIYPTLTSLQQLAGNP